MLQIRLFPIVAAAMRRPYCHLLLAHLRYLHFIVWAFLRNVVHGGTINTQQYAHAIISFKETNNRISRKTMSKCLSPSLSLCPFISPKG